MATGSDDEAGAHPTPLSHGGVRLELSDALACRGATPAMSRMPPTLMSVGDRPGHDPIPRARCIGNVASGGGAPCVSVDVHGDRAEVVITTQPPHPDGCWVYCAAVRTVARDGFAVNCPTVG